MQQYWPLQQPANNLWVGNNYSGYSVNRSNQYPVAMPQMPQMPQPPMNNIFSVMGPKGAEEFKIGPNSQVILVDTERPVVYFKRSDDSGYAKTRAFSISEMPFEVDSEVVSVESLKAPSLYLTKEEFSDFRREVRDDIKAIEELVMKHE